MKWFVWSINLTLAEVESQKTEMQLGVFFNYRVYARITGVNESHVPRFYVILQNISSGFELNIEEFNQCTKDIAKLYVKEYPWFYMPATVVKTLRTGDADLRF